MSSAGRAGAEGAAVALRPRPRRCSWRCLGVECCAVDLGAEDVDEQSLRGLD